MATLSVSNTFADGNTITAAGHNTNNSDIVNYINNRNSGSATWDAVSSASASNVPGTFNNSSGTQDILRCQDNGTSVLTVADGGATTARATDGGSSVALTVNNGTSTGSILIVQDNGSAVLTVADGGSATVAPVATSGVALTATAANGGTGKALIGNNGTSTGNIFEAQDNGSAVFTIADGAAITATGKLTFSGQPSFNAYNNANQSISDNTTTKAVFNTERYDAASNYSTASSEFTAPTAGRYFVSATVLWSTMTADKFYVIGIVNNGGTGFENSLASSFTWGYKTADQDHTSHVCGVVNLAANDVLEVRLIQNSGGAVNVLAEGTNSTGGLSSFSVSKIN